MKLEMSAVCMNGFLLLCFIACVHLSPVPEYVFGPERGRAEFTIAYARVDRCLLYKTSADGGDLLLVNSSHPKEPQPDGYRVKWSCQTGSFHITMSQLSTSQSGDYRAEVGRGGTIREQVSFRLIVCIEGGHDPSEEEVRYDDDAVLCQPDSMSAENGSSSSSGSSLRLYRSDWTRNNPSTQEVTTHAQPWRVPAMALVLDTNSSLEPLAEDLRGRLRVDSGDSVLRLRGVSVRDTDVYCTTWRGAQCQSYSYRVLRLSPKNVFAREDENLTLTCSSKGESPHHISWSTPTGEVQHGSNQSHQQEVMYMLNGSLTGDYSLIIPSVAQEHYGVYECKGSLPVMKIILYVCAKCSSATVMFHRGETVRLNITEHVNDSWSLDGLQWFHQKVLEPQVLILDSRDKFAIVPEDLRDRATVSNLHPGYSLIISNITEEDNGVYTWRVFGWDKGNPGIMLCSEGSIRLLHMHLFGVHTPFYRVHALLMGCGLLGLVAAVIWLKLRSRRGEQTSGRQSRQGQQGGGEDLYDDVEMAEINI